MMVVVTFWPSLTDTEGAEEYLEWGEIFDRFEVPQPFLGDKQPGWSPARFEPCRRSKDTVRGVHALCFDYDGGTRIEAAEAVWSGYFGMLHSTRRHTADEPRFRVILPLAREVSPFEYGELWKRVAPHAGNVDRAPKDPSRFWFTPGTDGEYHTSRFDGQPLDPDEWLARPLPREDRPAPVRPEVDVERRAVAYIDRMPAAISGCGGHQATWQVALVLARGFGLNESATFRILRDHFNSRCEPEWSERELEHKARDAANASQVPVGYLRDAEREWSPAPFAAVHQPVLVDAPQESPLPAEQPSTPPAPIAGPVDDPAVRHGFLSMRALLTDVFVELQKPKPPKGASTGHPSLNLFLGGFRRGNVTVFGAKRGFGKSSYGNLIANLAMERGKRVALFAGEDSLMIYGKRFLAMRADLNATRLRDNDIPKEAWSRVAEAIDAAPADPFIVRVEGRPVEWIAQAIRDVNAAYPIDLVIVDYLQCLRPAKKLQDRRNEVTYVCKTVGDAIKSAGAAGLVFSQLKRTDRVEPEIEDLKESGDIEDMAEHVLLGWKVDSVDDDRVPARFIKVAKNKDGEDAGDGSAPEMKWDAKTASFVDRDPEWDR